MDNNLFDIFGPLAPVLFTVVAYTAILFLSFTVLEYGAKIYYSWFARYHKMKLMTETERKCYEFLLSNFGDKYRILSKVRVADIVQVNNAHGDTLWNIFDPLTRMHADFVICSKKDLTPIIVIELDDRSHRSRKTAKNDRMKDKAYKHAKMPILRMPPQRKYDVEVIILLIQNSIQLTQPS